MFIARSIAERIQAMCLKYPIISLTGPRQSGKTTLLRHLLPNYRYVSLENADYQAFAKEDPRRFLATYDRYVIFDEVQRVPELFNYLQGKVDEDRLLGQYILSGSQNYLLMEGITQSLAGRVALFKLFPFTFAELKAVGYLPQQAEEAICKGFYPPVYDRDILPTDFYPNYLQTYIERDVRQLTVVQDLMLFHNFVRLCAGRIGQPVNYAALAADVGVSPVTAKAWMGILETSHIVFLLPPYYRNFAKRITKSPKLYFYDSGLAAHLLGIKAPIDLTVHFARGVLFENMIVAEFSKQQYEKGWNSNLYFWQDSNRREVDVLAERANKLIVAEIKSAKTINRSFFDNLQAFRKYAEPTFDIDAYLIYAGQENQLRTEASVREWQAVEGIF
ncbi:MAG TPA: ATP-binding protein [Saprospiraceae bacterium]|nr:ATP-binding protein [Saprospiraceae bacterium]HMQ82517.1 ATP-binding protein [Saprospiraceae bacterium]